MTVQLTSVYGINQLFIWMKMFFACNNKRLAAQIFCVSQIHLLSFCMNLHGFCICRCHLFFIHWRFYCAVKKKRQFISCLLPEHDVVWRTILCSISYLYISYFNETKFDISFRCIIRCLPLVLESSSKLAQNFITEDILETKPSNSPFGVVILTTCRSII